MNLVLVAFKADGARKDFRVRGEKCVIGRRPEADLRIPSPTVSRQHCEIVVQGGKAAIRDLGSSNGTFLNEVRVREATLAPGDRLSVGPVVFVVQVDGQPAEIEPVVSQTMPTSAAGDPRSATSAPVGGPMEESSMMAGSPPPSSGDSSIAPATAAKSGGDDDADDDDDDPLSRMFSKSKEDEDDSSVFEFDFDDLDEDEKKKR